MGRNGNGTKSIIAIDVEIFCIDNHDGEGIANAFNYNIALINYTEIIIYPMHLPPTPQSSIIIILESANLVWEQQWL